MEFNFDSSLPGIFHDDGLESLQSQYHTKLTLTCRVIHQRQERVVSTFSVDPSLHNTTVSASEAAEVQMQFSFAVSRVQCTGARTVMSRHHLVTTDLGQSVYTNIKIDPLAPARSQELGWRLPVPRLVLAWAGQYLKYR